MSIEEFESGLFGVSWTLEKSVSEFFAFDFTRNKNPSSKGSTVVELEVHKSEIIALFLDRNETEVILKPRSLF